MVNTQLLAVACGAGRRGIVTPSGSGSGTLGTRNSFPARRAAIRVLHEAMKLDTDEDE
jgi:hypothetical protein